MTYRNICFTLNNPFDNDGLWLCDWLENNCSFGVIGFETGAGGTEHWQGYCEFKCQKRHSSISGGRFKWHFERRKGTQEQACKYCKKDDAYIVWGVAKSQGERSDLDAVRQMALDDGMRGVVRTFNSQGIRVAEKYLTYCETPRREKPKVIYITGPSGCGKSRLARELVDDDGLTDDCYVKSEDKWWDGYDGHQAVILDDFRGSWWSITYMLVLLDRYECRVEYKGGTRQMKASLFVITSIVPLDELYARTGECKHQLSRRIDDIRDLTPFEEYSDDEGDNVDFASDVAEVGG